VEIDPFAPAAIAYTSGTTGFPKGAVHSQHNLLLVGAVARLTGNRPRPPQHGVVLPLTILNLFVLGPLCILQDGRTCVCMDRIDARGVAEWVRDERIGSFDGVPTVIHDLLTDPEIKEQDLVTLTEPIMGGADSPPEVVRLFRERFGGEVIIGYGMTEAPTAVTWSDGTVPPGPGLCGRPVPQVEIEVLDESGEPVPSGEVGEICVRPARSGDFAGVYTPMLGYWNKPEATREVLRGDRYHTGDLGVLAADGNLYIRGRRNDLILRGGANVYPAEVERVLQSHPAVAAAAVLGVPDQRLGERVVAAVQLLPAAEADEERLIDHTRAQLARYKVPEALCFVDEMPRNAMNKIVKSRLRDLFERDRSPA
jgi:acyl-CoA synthetase (AMP-forming)/AMP-acid ligase II